MIIGEDIILVSPIKVIVRLFELVQTKVFWSAIGFSFFRIILGFLLAMAFGVVLGALAGRWRLVKDLLEPLVQAVKTIPVASLVILLLFWFSADSLSIVISLMIVFPIVYTNVITGVKATDGKLLQMADVFGLNGLRRLRYIYVPQVMPFFVGACKVGLGLCWKSGIAAEVIAIASGSIGAQLYFAKIYLVTADVFAWTLVIIVISVGFEKLFLWAVRAATDKLARG